jgi:acetolactate synthase regulatory subunit
MARLVVQFQPGDQALLRILSLATQHGTIACSASANTGDAQIAIIEIEPFSEQSLDLWHAKTEAIISVEVATIERFHDRRTPS